MNTHASLTNFFRHEYGHLVATLCHKVGTEFIEDIEDAVQSALLKALQKWTHKAMPDQPSAWLFTVASREVLSRLKQKNRRTTLLQEYTQSIAENPIDQQESDLQAHYHQDTLQWLFYCCHPSIAIESQLVFALKTLCGFSIKEIALRLFISEENAYKRFARARNYLKKHTDFLEATEQSTNTNRLNSVNKVLYLMFTEGHLSSHLKYAIRRELCDDAIRLTSLLVKKHDEPQTCALLSLMHLQMARFSARQSDNNELLLLSEQDRSLWDSEQIKTGLYWLAKSAQGTVFSSYHAQANIAAEHCLAATYQQTRWDNIVKAYQLLEKVAPSAVHRLNAIVAMAELQGPTYALQKLESFDAPDWLKKSHQWHAVAADLYLRCDQKHMAQKHITSALQLAPNEAIKNCLSKRLQVDKITNH